MADVMLPPDQGTELRNRVDRWADLWHARYSYPVKNGSKQEQSQRQVDSAPAYTRSFAWLVAGLFQRQSPSYVGTGEDEAVPMTELELADLLGEVVAKAAGFGQVLIRPVFDGVRWIPSVLAPTSYAVEWAHRRATGITVWDYAQDPRTADQKAGLAIVEQWQPGVQGQPGTVTTTVYETVTGMSGQTELGAAINVDSPPDALAQHPFVVSAQNDSTPRDLFVYVWAWEDIGPVSLFYGNEGVVDGLARLWDQEQDDAEMTRRRVAMPKDLVGTSQVLADGTQTILARPGFNKHDNILLLSAGMSAEHGPNGGVTPIEFDDDLIQRERIERRENSLLEQVGINPSSIGRHVGGRSDSAAAKRADNQMTMNTITGPARHAEQLLSMTVTELARLSPTIASTGFQVAVHEGLKENPAESADVARALRDADAASTFTLVQTAHPTWDVDQVLEEVARMQDEGSALAPLE